MEADWSIEIGADLPAIIVPWDGFVDLRQNLSLVSRIEEAAGSSGLAQALIKLNQEPSPVFTSKCDLWPLSEDEIDPLEFDAGKQEAKLGIACYVDIVAREAGLFTSFTAMEAWVRAVTDELRQVSMPQSRAELVVRTANVDTLEGFAITLYVAACAATEIAARRILGAALEMAATITMKQATATGE